MYIELFLLDNFTMDMIIIKTASVLCGLKDNSLASVAVSIVMSVFSAFAMVYPWLCSLPFKILLCGICALPFYVEQKRITVSSVFAVLISTFAVGGLVTAMSVTVQSKLIASSYLRLFLYPAFFLLTLPSAVRHLLKGRANKNFTSNIEVEHKGITVKTEAVIDTGSTLTEPISGIPVVIIYAPQLMRYASIPLMYTDTRSGERMINAFKPQSVKVGGVCVNVLIAPIDADSNMKAIVPYGAVCNIEIKERECKCKNERAV